ncbi:hypothetical protein FOXB_02516 [Fusarium oxysporum f. sp. conglutinans Fo5176]|uniref:Uncharacterized protein n=1 Tax=Fusarium oxysporum (strain Fo5176) TaxID=660025 RepID=F9F7Z1_FUSOF|nr:hypothetical protein FOXB_02516 [Fusarium oxysporum f. sp. conglutinans Fo5176]
MPKAETPSSTTLCIRLTYPSIILRTSARYTNIPILRDDEIAKEVEKWRLEINTLNKLFSGLILKAKLQAELVKLARGTVYFVVSGHRDNVSALSAARVAWHDQRNSSKINRNRNYIPSPSEQEGPGGGQDDNLLDALANVPEGFVWPSVNQKKIEISNIPGSHGSLGIRNPAIANGKRYGGSRVEEEPKRRGPK